MVYFNYFLIHSQSLLYKKAMDAQQRSKLANELMLYHMRVSLIYPLEISGVGFKSKHNSHVFHCDVVESYYLVFRGLAGSRIFQTSTMSSFWYFVRITCWLLNFLFAAKHFLFSFLDLPVSSDRSYNFTCVRSFVRSFVRSLVRSFIRSFVCPLVKSFFQNWLISFFWYFGWT